MKYNTSDVLLRAGFATVAKYDPALYRRMVAEDWDISTNVRESFPMYWTEIPRDLVTGTQTFGVTLPDTTPGQETAGVYINRSAVHQWARSHGVPIEMFVATVLAHEFQHIHNSEEDPQVSEPPAFRAGSAFAAKLPTPYGTRIKAMSDRVLREMLAGQIAQYNR